MLEGINGNSYCYASLISIDRFSGQRLYARCADVNLEGNCLLYEIRKVPEAFFGEEIHSGGTREN